MGIHARLSASSSKRWINCPASARLEEQFPNESSVYALEGTFAHEVCEHKVRKYLGQETDRPHSEEYESSELETNTDLYAEFVINIIEQLKKNGSEPLALVEERLDYSHIAPEGFGTGDMVILGEEADGSGLLHIVDYKNGKGVFVSADHNSQMMLYALGALHKYSFIWDIQTVRMSIVQPRKENISTCEMPVEELIAWGDSIKPIAKQAFVGGGSQNPGDWCRFCRAKPVCRACMDEALSVANGDFVDISDDFADASEDFIDIDEALLQMEKADSDGDSPSDGESSSTSDDTAPNDPENETDMTSVYRPDTKTVVFKSPGLVPIAELAEKMPTLSRIHQWIDSVFAYVSAEAINHQVEIPGYKVVRGRRKRIFTDQKAVIEAAEKNGYTDLYKKKLLSLTEFEDLMGKANFNKILGDYVLKPPGKLTLVPESDPRPAVEEKNDAEHDFVELPDIEDEEA